MGWLSTAWAFIKWLAGLISGKPSDPVATVASEGERTGRSEQQASDAISAARSAEAVAQAESQAPRTIDDSIDRAEKGII